MINISGRIRGKCWYWDCPNAVKHVTVGIMAGLVEIIVQGK